jgi:hypothetical protein
VFLSFLGFVKFAPARRPRWARVFSSFLSFLKPSGIGGLKFYRFSLVFFVLSSFCEPGSSPMVSLRPASLIFSSICDVGRSIRGMQKPAAWNDNDSIYIYIYIYICIYIYIYIHSFTAARIC